MESGYSTKSTFQQRKMLAKNMEQVPVSARSTLICGEVGKVRECSATNFKSYESPTSTGAKRMKEEEQLSPSCTFKIDPSIVTNETPISVERIKIEKDRDKFNPMGIESDVPMFKHIPVDNLKTEHGIYDNTLPSVGQESSNIKVEVAQGDYVDSSYFNADNTIRYEIQFLDSENADVKPEVLTSTILSEPNEKNETSSQKLTTLKQEKTEKENNSLLKIKEEPTEIMPKNNTISVGRIKVEVDLGTKPSTSNLALKNKTITSPEINHISVGEIKIEDVNYGDTSLASGEEDSDIEMEIPKNDCIELTSESEDDNCYFEMEFEDSSNSSKLYEKGAEGSTKNTFDSKNFFEQDIKNKQLILELIEEYRKTPQIWHGEISHKFTASEKTEFLEGIANTLNIKFDIELAVARTKTLLFYVCKKYEKEIERQLRKEKERIAANSSLWFYDKMDFLKEEFENKLKPILETPTGSVLDENLLGDLIHIYKNYDGLWDGKTREKFDNKSKLKRHKLLLKMCGEVKEKMKIFIDIITLQNQLLYIHKIFSKDKRSRFKCEKLEEFKPSFSYFYECDFLEDHEAPFRCLMCNEIYEEYVEFKNHSTKHNQESMTLQFGGKICNKETVFNNHHFRHSHQEFKCYICGKEFKNEKPLKRHMRTVKHYKTYKCGVCGEVYKDEKSFKCHMALHGDKPFICHICSKGFTDRKYLSIHKWNIHRQEDIKCKICGEICKNSKALKYHMFRHSGENYKCDICGKSCNHPDLLKLHKVVHEKNYKCEDCGTKFGYKKNLTSHLKKCNYRNNETKKVL